MDKEPVVWLCVTRGNALLALVGDENGPAGHHGFDPPLKSMRRCYSKTELEQVRARALESASQIRPSRSTGRPPGGVWVVITKLDGIMLWWHMQRPSERLQLQEKSMTSTPASPETTAQSIA